MRLHFYLMHRLARKKMTHLRCQSERANGNSAFLDRIRNQNEPKITFMREATTMKSMNNYIELS